MSKVAISHLSADDRTDIRNAVLAAVRYWPNAHLGSYTPREDIRSAFRMLRSHAAHHGYLQAGIGAVQRDACAHSDM